MIECLTTGNKRDIVKNLENGVIPMPILLPLSP